jgi:hypothetical protein
MSLAFRDAASAHDHAQKERAGLPGSSELDDVAAGRPLQACQTLQAA